MKQQEAPIVAWIGLDWSDQEHHIRLQADCRRRVARGCNQGSYSTNRKPSSSGFNNCVGSFPKDGWPWPWNNREGL